MTSGGLIVTRRANAADLGKLLRLFNAAACSGFLVALGLSSVQASCGHYVHTRSEWLAAQTLDLQVASGSSDASRLVWRTAAAELGGRASELPWRRPSRPCQGPECGRGADLLNLVIVVPDTSETRDVCIETQAFSMSFGPGSGLLSMVLGGHPQCHTHRLFRPPQM